MLKSNSRFAGENFGGDGTAMDFDLNMDSFCNNKNYEDKNFELATFTQPIPKVKLVWDITTNT